MCIPASTPGRKLFPPVQGCLSTAKSCAVMSCTLECHRRVQNSCKLLYAFSGICAQLIFSTFSGVVDFSTPQSQQRGRPLGLNRSQQPYCSCCTEIKLPHTHQGLCACVIHVTLAGGVFGRSFRAPEAPTLVRHQDCRPGSPALIGVFPDSGAVRDHNLNTIDGGGSGLCVSTTL